MHSEPRKKEEKKWKMQVVKSAVLGRLPTFPRLFWFTFNFARHLKFLSLNTFKIEPWSSSSPLSLLLVLPSSYSKNNKTFLFRQNGTSLQDKKRVVNFSRRSVRIENVEIFQVTSDCIYNHTIPLLFPLFHGLSPFHRKLNPDIIKLT